MDDGLVGFAHYPGAAAGRQRDLVQAVGRQPGYNDRLRWNKIDNPTDPGLRYLDWRHHGGRPVYE